MPALLPIDEIQSRSLRPTSPSVKAIREPSSYHLGWRCLYPIHRFANWLAAITASPGLDAIPYMSEPTPSRTPTESPTESSAKSPIESPASLDTIDQGSIIRLAIGQVLEVLEKQIDDISSDVESSVVNVCQGFQGMAQRAQAAVQAAKSIVESKSTSDGDEDLVTEMRHVVTSMLNNIQSSSQFSQSVSHRLTDLDTRLETVEKMLMDVDELAMKAKIVALNAQIEAFRLGKAGIAVGIVAQESKELSMHAVSTNRSVRKVTEELMVEIRSTSAEIQRRIESDSSSSCKSELAASHLLNAIQETHQHLLQSLGTTASISRELQGDIARAVMSMQFQDRVSQRLEHVVHSLKLLSERSVATLSAENQNLDQLTRMAKSLSDEWLREINQCYTMESERRSTSSDSHSTAAMSSSSEADTFDVELF